MASSHAEIAEIATSASRRARIDIWPGVFFAAVIAASIVILALLAVVIWLSFRDGSLGDPDAAWSFANYPTIFLDGFTYRVLANTLGFSLIALVVALVFGVPIAWLVERTDLPGKPLIFTLMAIGLLIPGLRRRDGLAVPAASAHRPRQCRGCSSVLGLARRRSTSPASSAWAGCKGLSLAPLAFIMTAAVFRAIDPALEEAAQMCGRQLRARRCAA